MFRHRNLLRHDRPDGPLTEYDNELFKRFVDKVVVKENGFEVRFKAGISVKV